MGTTFTTLHIKTGVHEFKSFPLPAGYSYLRTADEWITVYEQERPRNLSKMQKLGRDLSQAIDAPVIAVSYFDDDLFEMCLMRAGKKEASYKTGPGVNQVSRGSAFLDALGLTGKEASAFRYLLKNEMSLQANIDSFSRLLGVKLSSDSYSPKDSDTLWHKDTASVIREIEEEKKLNRVKNHTSLVLQQEIPGLEASLCMWNLKLRDQDARDRVVRLVRPLENGEYDFSHIYCLQEKDGRLNEIYDYRYPKEIFSESDKDMGVDYEGHEVYIMDKEACFDCADWDYYEPIFSRLITIPEARKQNGKYTPVWNYHYDNVARAEKPYAYEYSYDEGKLSKINLQTSDLANIHRDIVAEYRYEDSGEKGQFDVCNPPLVVGDHVIMIRLKKKSWQSDGHNRVADIRFFDKNLSLIRQEEVPAGGSDNIGVGSCIYIPERDCLYFNNMSLDLKTHEWDSYSKNVSGSVLPITDVRGYIYIETVHSLYVMDQDKNLLSRHQFKGIRSYYYLNEAGNLCFITSSDAASNWNPAKKGACIRVYEVKPL